MSDKTLYISNLPSTATAEELSLKLGKCGTVVSADIALDADTGRSRGFAIVQMSSRAEAMAAIQRLNLTSYDGRLMSVNLVRPENVTSGG